MDVLKAITGNDDKSILEECRRVQTATVKEYRDKLRNYKFSSEIRNYKKTSCRTGTDFGRDQRIKRFEMKI